MKIVGLVGYEGRNADAKYRYWVEMSVPELLMVVAEVMKAAPSPDLLRVVAEGAATAMPRQRRKRKS